MVNKLTGKQELKKTIDLLQTSFLAKLEKKESVENKESSDFSDDSDDETEQIIQRHAKYQE